MIIVVYIYYKIVHFCIIQTKSIVYLMNLHLLEGEFVTTLSRQLTCTPYIKVLIAKNGCSKLE